MITGKEFRSRSDRRIAAEAPGTDLLVHQSMMDLVRASLRLDADFDAAAHRPRGITYAGWRLLFCLWSAGPLQTSELARLLAITAPTVSSTMKTLEARGLLERDRTSEDRRAVTVRITPAGDAVVVDAFAAMHARARRWMEGIPAADLRAFARVLATIASRARPED